MRDEIMGETFGAPRKPPSKGEILVARLRDFIKYDVRDFILNWFVPVGLICLVGVVCAIVVITARDEQKEKAAHEARFMAECQQDKKHYECEAMWRAGEDHEHMIPVVIPMPSGR